MEKRCSACGIVKPLECFNLYIRSKDSHYSICKECKKLKEHDFYLRHKVEILNRTHKYYQTHKKEVKERCHIYRQINKEVIKERERNYRQAHTVSIKKYLHNYRQANKEKLKERDRIYFQVHKEQIREQRKQYYKKHPQTILKCGQRYRKTPSGRINGIKSHHKRRIREKELASEADLTITQWQHILKLQNGRCNLCQKPFTVHRKATVDHILPLSKGGVLTTDNIQALCISCNSKKQDKINIGYIQTWGHPSLIYASKSQGVSPEVSQST